MLHKNGITIDPVALTITYAGKSVRFRPLRRRSILFDMASRLILGPPATFIELFDTVYGNDPSGGPEGGKKATEIHMQHLKHKLAPLGLKIHKARAHRDTGWCEKWVAP